MLASMKPLRMYLAASVLGLVGCVLGYGLLPPWHRFDLQSRVADCDDVYALAALAANFEQVGHWTPEFIRPEAIRELAAWIRFTANQSAEEIRELRRDGSRQFATVNGQILLLDKSGQGNLVSLRKLSSEQLEQELLARLTYCRDARRDASLAKIAHQPANQRLLARCDCSPFPEKAGWLRRTIFGQVSARSADRQRWVSGFVHAVERDVRPVARQYAAIDRQNVIRLPTSGEGLLQLSKRETLDLPSTSYRGAATTSDFNLLWLEAGSDVQSPQRIHDTGLRMIQLKWVRDAKEKDVWRPEWPPLPQQIAIRADRLKEFLTEFGLPSSIVVRTGKLAVAGNWENCRLSVKVEVSSIDFAAWKQEFELQLDGQSSATLRGQLAQATTKLHDHLLAFVKNQTSLCGVPALFSVRAEHARELDVVVQHPQFGELKLLAILGNDGQFAWSTQLTAQDRLRLVDKLAESNPELKGRQTQLQLARTVVEPANNEIEFDFRFLPADPESQAKTEAQPAVQWAIRGTQPRDSVVQLPPELPPEVKLPEAPTAVLAVSATDLHSAFVKTLAQDYPRLAKCVSAAVASRAGGMEVRLTLQLGDWKELELGPEIISSADEVRPKLKTLLSSESVQRASQLQWRDAGEFSHPKYGAIRAEITNWSPQNATAEIRGAFQVKSLGEIAWHEQTQLHGDEWTSLDAALLADQIEPRIVASLARLHDFIPLEIPANSVEFKLDRTGIDGTRWLALNPMRIALEGTARLPFFENFLPPVKLSGILLDAKGLHVPEEYGLALPITIPLPHFAVTEPAVLVSLRDPSLRANAKVTPPAIPGPGPNSWLDVMYTDLSVRGYWQRPQFDGAMSVAIAGTPNVGHGNVVTNFRKSSLTGNVRAGGPIPGLPSMPARLGGSLDANGAKRSLEIQSRAQVIDQDVVSLTLEAGGAQRRADIDPRFDDPQGFGVRGKLRVPMIASMNVNGELNSRLSQYTIRGRGNAGPVSCLLTATEEDVRMEKELKTDGKVTFWDEWDPNLTTTAEPDPEDVVGLGLMPGMSGREVSPTEEKFATKNFRPRATGGSDHWTGETKTAPTEHFCELDLSNAEFQFVSNKLQMRLGKRLIIEIPEAQLPAGELKDWKAFAWQSNEGPGHFLFLKKETGDARHFSFSSPTEVKFVRDYPSLPLAREAAKYPGMIVALAKRLFRLRVVDADEVQLVTEPTAGPLAGTYILEYSLKDAFTTSVWEFISASERPCVSDLHPQLLGWSGAATKMKTSWVEKILEQRPTHDLPRLIRFSFEEDHVSTGWYLAETRRAETGTIIITDVKTPTEGRKEFSFCGLQLTLADRLKRAQTLVLAAELQSRLSQGQAWFGESGVLVDAGEYLWLIRDSGGDAPEVDRLSRESFNQWISDSASKLPEDWRSEEQRRGLDVAAIARAALSNDFSTADRILVPVHRLGLLQTLARETETNKHEPSP